MKFIVAIAALLASSASAFAADLSPAAVEPVAPAASPFSWAGFYLGLNAGYGGGKVKSRASRTGSEFVEGSPIPFSEDLGAFEDTARGFVGGGQGGYNYQFGKNLVVGAETDIQYSGIDTDSRNRDLRFVPVITKTELSWYGTTRLRAGYALDNILFYGTGGLAYGHVKETLGTTFGPESPVISAGDTRVGWAAGGGLEYAVDDHWSIKAEYLYVDLGKTKNVGVPLPIVLGATNVHVNTRSDLAVHTARIGVNYRF